MSNITYNNYDVDKTCRTCLKQTEDEMNQLFDVDKPTEIWNKLKLCTSVEIISDNQMPSKVCLCCMDKLKSAFDFLQQCQLSNEVLLNIKDQNKIEKADECSMNDSLKIILKSNTDRNKYMCEICDKIYQTHGHLNLHMKIHSADGFTCTFCTKKFTQKGALTNHLKKHYGLKQSDYLDNNGSSEMLESVYMCRICLRTFANQGLLNAHLRIEHTKVERSTCQLCKQIFTARLSLIQHMKRHMGLKTSDRLDLVMWKKHIEEESMKISVIKKADVNSGEDFLDVPTHCDRKCSICHENFSSYVQLKSHTRSHFDIKYPCDKCPRKFANPICLQQHKEKHIRKKLNCEYCFKKFTAPSELKLHVRIHTRERPYSCDLCSKTFSYKSGLKIHVQRHNQLKPHLCNVCGQNFKLAEYLNNHMRTHDSVFKCNACHLQFPSRTGLKEHATTHNSVAEINLCNYCGYTTTCKSGLTSHMRKHTGEAPYPCQLCPRRFRSRGSRSSHLLMHSGQRKHCCATCGKRYVNASGLKAHLLTHENNKPVLEKPFGCRECNKTFAKEKDLKIHEILHSGDFPWRCGVCQRGFNRVGNYKMHMRRHTGVRSYVCDACGFAFFSSSTLKIHLRTHTGERPFSCALCESSFATAGGLRRHNKRLHLAVEKHCESNRVDTSNRTIVNDSANLILTQRCQVDIS